MEHHDDSHMAAVALDRLDVHKLSYPPRDEFVTPNRVFVTVDVSGQEQIQPMRIG